MIKEAPACLGGEEGSVALRQVLVLISVTQAGPSGSVEKTSAHEKGVLRCQKVHPQGLGCRAAPELQVGNRNVCIGAAGAGPLFAVIREFSVWVALSRGCSCCAGCAQGLRHPSWFYITSLSGVCPG